MRLFKCPSCGEENTSEQWNEATISHYRKAGYARTQSRDSVISWYYCPSCGMKIDGKYIKRIMTE